MTVDRRPFIESENSTDLRLVPGLRYRSIAIAVDYFDLPVVHGSQRQARHAGRVARVSCRIGSPGNGRNGTAESAGICVLRRDDPYRAVRAE